MGNEGAQTDGKKLHPDDLSSLSCAVLTKEYEGDLAEGEWSVYAAFATKKMAEEWASAQFGDRESARIIREIKG